MFTESACHYECVEIFFQVFFKSEVTNVFFPFSTEHFTIFEKQNNLVMQRKSQRGEWAAHSWGLAVNPETQSWPKCWEQVTVEQASSSPSPRPWEHSGKGGRECKSWREGKNAVKCGLLHMTWLLHSGTNSSVVACKRWVLSRAEKVS